MKIASTEGDSSTKRLYFWQNQNLFLAIVLNNIKAKSARTAYSPSSC
jgi:hypothetical protein